MIQVHELHIGNYFINPEGQIEQCFGTIDWMDSVLINPLADWSMETYDGYKPEDCNGLPLTPDIVKGCGYQDKGSYFKMPIKEGAAGLRIAFVNDEWHVSIGSDEYGILFRVVKYLHRFQNIHHAITGQELEVNLPANQTT